MDAVSKMRIRGQFPTFKGPGHYDVVVNFGGVEEELDGEYHFLVLEDAPKHGSGVTNCLPFKG